MALAAINIKFQADLKQFSTQMQNANRSIKKMGSQLQSVGAGLSVGLTAPILGVGAAALHTASNFEQLEVRMKTAFMGSEEAAKNAFDTILEFTAKTPFQVEEVADAFIKLKNLGLDPSEASLTSYGNTAAAMGKSLNQLIEAVADAATGEFERLKEFGIKAKSEGDNVSFTFQGVTKTVGKNAAEITAYLQELGNVNFAGAMEAQTKTFQGQLSNLKDTLSLIGNEIGKIILDFVKPFVESLKNAAEGFKNLSPEAKKTIVVFGGITAALGPLLLAIGLMMTNVIPGLIAAFGYLRAGLLLLQTQFIRLTAIIAANPFGAIAVGITAAIAAFVYFNRETDKVIEKQSLLSEVNDMAAKSIANEKAKLEELLFIARNENIEKSARIKAIQELNKLSPEFLGNLSLETINTNAATEAIKLYNDELLKSAKVKAAQQKLQEIQSKLIDEELRKEAASINLVKEKSKIIANEGQLNNEQKSKLLSVNKQISDLSKVYNDSELKNLKEQETALLKIIGANQTLTKIIKEKPVSGETNLAKGQVLDGPSMRDGLEIDNSLLSGLSTTRASFETELSAFEMRLEDFNRNASSIISNTATDVLSGFGEMIAGLATGNLTLKDVAGGLMRIIGDMAIQLGKSAIAIGVGMLAIKAAFKNPFTAIAAGVALVALGAIINSSVANMTSGGNDGGRRNAGAFANGGMVPGNSFSGDKLFARVNSGEMILNRRQQGNLMGMLSPSAGTTQVILQPSIDFDGRNFKVMLDKVDKNLNRIK